MYNANVLHVYLQDMAVLQKSMLPAVICLVSVICTASLALFGMDSASPYAQGTGHKIEDVSRDPATFPSAPCFAMFKEFFAALAVLVCIAYYAVVKCSLLAMGAVLMDPPRPHPLYEEEDGFVGSEMTTVTTDHPDPQASEDDVGNDTFSVLSSLSSSSSSIATNDGENQQVGAGEGERSSGYDARIATSPRHQQPVDDTRRGERFNAVKIWTNIYGLSIGIYCLVYSLLMPSELSAFVFCVSSLVASLHEFLVPCIEAYLYEDAYYHELGGLKHKRAGGRSSRTKAVKRCLGWLCILQDSMADEIRHAAREGVSSAGRMVSTAKVNKSSKARKGAEVAASEASNQQKYGIRSCIQCMRSYPACCCCCTSSDSKHPSRCASFSLFLGNNT